MNRSGYDRRLGEDQRLVHDLNYFEAGGIERRIERERRRSPEKRIGWLRVGQWNSVPVGACPSEIRLVGEDGGGPIWKIS